MQRYLTLLIIAFAVMGVAVSTCLAQDAVTNEQRLLEVAKNGRVEEVTALLEAGAAVNARDAQGRTALYLAAQGGHQATAQALLDHGADPNIKDNAGRSPLSAALANGHTGTAQSLRSRGAIGGAPAANSEQSGKFHPDAQYTTAAAFSQAIGEPAVMLESSNVYMLVPKKRESAARIVLPYLARAYDELYKIVGVHTKYKILVYAFPKSFPGKHGGTSGCIINYTDENLDLNNQSEWKQYHVPHVSGYIEEMAHNFVAASKARFTSEMVGWSISVGVSMTVARNPIHDQSVAQTRRGQEETYRRYLALGQTIPADLAWNQADRVHAYLLYKCEQQYGMAFWSDFFKEVRKERQAFSDAEARGEDNGRDLRYKLTLQCFDRLPGIRFTQLLEQNGISTIVDLSSLPHEAPGWNRKLH